MPRYAEVPFQVHADHCVPLVLAHVVDHPVAQDPRVVHDDVQTTELTDGLVNKRFRLPPIGDVCAVGDRLSARRSYFVHNLLRRALFLRPVDRDAVIVHNDRRA